MCTVLNKTGPYMLLEKVLKVFRVNRYLFYLDNQAWFYKCSLDYEN